MMCLDAMNTLLAQQRLTVHKDRGGKVVYKDVGAVQAIKCASQPPRYL